MAQTTISIRMDEELKKNMELTCQELGMNMTTAFTIFAKKMTREHAIPFEVSGKDYLRLAKNEAIAKKLFQNKLKDAISGPHIIYVISEKEHLTLVPDGALKVLVTADLDVIKERFAQRMRGDLPAPVATMLERKHGCFDAEICDIHVVSGRDDLDEVCISIQNRVNSL